VERGYAPGTLEEVTLLGDLDRLSDLDEAARRIQPYDDEFYAWQDVRKELSRLGSAIRFYHGPHRFAEHHDGDGLCQTGCVMGIKIFLAGRERLVGREAFAEKLKPAVLVAGRVDEPIDAAGEEVFLVGKCARATIRNAKKITRFDKCFTTVREMDLTIGPRLGPPLGLREAKILAGIARDTARSSLSKLVSLRWAQDLGSRMRRGDREQA
jgi:hypothetical protein